MAKTKWYREMTVYQIWTRSFCDGNGDGIGDLYGVLSKLDYIRSLGVDAIWFSPLYPSPNADFGYDISDYMNIHPDFGDLPAFQKVLDRAHEMGMRVFMDLVINHTSDEHPWFRESRKSHNNPYHDYYIWRHGRVSRGRRYPPNNWTSMFEGDAWEYDEKLGEYYLHLFAVKQPDLNMANPAVREEVKKIMRFWLDMGVDGFREDVITYIGKHPEFPDTHPKLPLAGGHQFYVNRPEAYDYLKEFKHDVLDHYDCFTVGESPLTTADTALKYISEGPEQVLDEMIAFSHMEADCFMTDMVQRPFNLRKMKRAFTDWQTKLQGKAWNALYIENHDHPRIISRYGSEEYREESGKMLAAMYMLQRGTPFIYQGQEIGMTNIRMKSLDEFQDVMSRNGIRLAQGLLPKSVILKLANRASRENSRTPLQWSDAPNAGFTTGTPWFPVNENYRTVNAAAQEKDPDSLLNFYRGLIAYRKDTPVVLYGDYQELDQKNGHFYTYERNYLNKKLLVICCFTAEPLRYEAPVGIDLEKGNLVMSNYKQSSIVENGFTARPYELRVYYFDSEKPEHSYEGLRK
ncbi:MAG: alpha-glucosidase [Oscillospiraceae bacterium]|nr:alpha-glucosidase [Oscillospiraceae bacterium]